jgi:outer membrane protein OmpA-like peptidoglycan-associated protein
MKSLFPKIFAPLFLLIYLGVLPNSTEAQFPKHGLYIGAYGGYSPNLADWQLGDVPGLWANPPTTLPKSSALAGLRLGYHFIPQLALEFGGGILPISSTAGGKNTIFKLDADLYYQFINKNFTPFFGIGAGNYILRGGDLNKDMDGQLHASAGLRWLVAPRLAIRAEVRDYLIESFTKSGWGNKLELTAGIDFFLTGVKKKVVIIDSDNDGIPDERDNCPNVFGTALMKGCPDRDRDGIADDQDNCPDERGVASNNGCPQVLDRDNDGIPDESDQCPDEYGPERFSGCPDKDGDGVPDKDDKCPEITGLPDHDGCVPEEVKKFTGAIKGINFKTGSSAILSTSFKLLDQAVSVLNEFPTLRIRIDGHTDNVGKAEYNQKLSEDRAAKVKEYFVSKQIDETRIETYGNGDSSPVADNSTAAGRAENRRIEFTILGQ